MTLIPTTTHQGLQLTPTHELAVAPRAVVRFGIAPDGLPWLLDVDRSARLNNLFTAVLSAFDLRDLEDLPKRVRDALEHDVAAGLMGVHSVSLAGSDEPSDIYVSRRNARQILGRTLLSQLLEGGAHSLSAEPSYGAEAATNTSAITTDLADTTYAEAVEQAIRERNSARHLLITLNEGMAWVGTVAAEDRPLRTPQGPFRPLVFESLVALKGTQARFLSSNAESWTVPLADQQGYFDTMLRASQNRYGGRVEFEVPRAAILEVLIELARLAGALHGRGVVHADLSPGNVLIEAGKPVSFDALELPVGAIAAAATFDWAPPEQVVGMALGPSSDVYAIGRMMTALIGGVPFGEETQYIVPTGGLDSRRVQILKTDGVFIDILGTDYDRAWQLAWQGLLGRSLAFDTERRPVDGNELADAMAELAESHPVRGTMSMPGSFGTPVRLEAGDGWTYARRVSD
ncbi:MAG: hypothetical protein AAGC55_06835 [Myxococcota bacterium]